jgi:hypothetical protein
MHQRRQHFSDHRLAEYVQKKERLEVWKDRGGQEPKAPYLPRKASCVLNGDGRASIVPDHMPFLHTSLNAKSFNLFCQAIEIVTGVWNEGCFSHTGQVDGKASVIIRELLDNAVPKHAIGGQAVDEENGIAFTLVLAMHGVAPFSHRPIDAIWRLGERRTG